MANDWWFLSTATQNEIVQGNRALTRSIRRALDGIEDAFDALPAQADFRAYRLDYGVDSGAADAYVITLVGAAPSAYQAGQSVRFIAGASNTGASTVNVNGLGSRAIQRETGDPLEAGDIAAGRFHVLDYDGTAFRLRRAEQGATGTITAAGDGTVGAPGIAWAADTNTGFRRAGSGDQRVVSDGADVLTLLPASQAEAEAGADNAKVMTALRTKQQVDARLADSAQAIAGTDTSDLMTPALVKTAIDKRVMNLGNVTSGARFTYPGIVTVGTANTFTTAIHYLPIFVPEDVTISGISISSNKTSGNVRLGLYTNAAGLPGTLIVDAGQAAFSNTLMTLSVSQALTAGWYWAAAVNDGSQATFRTIEVAAAVPNGITGTNGTPGLGYRDSDGSAYTSGLPATAAATAADLVTSTIPLLLLTV